MKGFRRQSNIKQVILWFQMTCITFAAFAGRNGGMRTTSFKGVEKFRVVECYTRALPSHVLGLSLFELRMRSETLVSMKFTTKECKPHSDFGFCNFTTGESTTASVKVLISDLINGEMRAYGCDASYYDNQPWTETYTINVTMGGTAALLAETTTLLQFTQAQQTFPSRTTPDFTTEEAGATTDNFPADDGTSSRQVFDVTSVATGAAVCLAIVTIVIVVRMCQRRCGPSAPCTHRQAQRNPHAQVRNDRQHMELPPLPPAEPPDEAAEHDFRDATSSDYLNPVYKRGAHPADPPERHFFRRPEGSDSTSHYEVVP